MAWNCDESGGVYYREEDMRRLPDMPWVETVLQDIRYALRGFRRAPVFTIAAAVAIALGIGTSTAVFSVVDRILFRPLPYPDSGRLVSFGMLAPSMDRNEFLMADGYVRFRAHQTPFSSITSFGFISDCDLTEPNPARLRCAMVESTFLPTFGIQPLIGRNFTRQEDRPNAPKVALLTFGFWKSRFAGDPAVAGKAIPVDGQPTTIVGVLPPDFELFNLSPVDLVIPEALDERREHSGRAFRVFARLKRGVTVQQAREALQPLFEEARRDAPAPVRREIKLVVRSLRDRQVEDVRLASWTLFGAVLAVLLIACANVANLMLARSASRRRELAIRSAIGAGRARLVRQAMTESLLLGGIGALAGCGLAWVLLRLLIASAPGAIPRLNQAALDGRVLLFAVALSVISGALFGLAPALESPSAETLSAGRAVVTTRGLLRHFLIAGQIAASLVLATGAGLLLRSLWNLEKVPLGVDTGHTLSARFVLSKAYGQDARLLAFFDGLEARLNRLAGTAVYGIGDSIPPSGGTRAMPYFTLNVEGRPALPQGAGGYVDWRYITPGYFAAMGIPVPRGRAFTERDRNSPELPMVLSETLARRLFPGYPRGRNPIGAHVLRSASGAWHTVVGVAGDVRNLGLDRQPDPEFYLLRKHAPDDTFRNQAPGDGWRAATVVVRGPFQPQAMANLLCADLADLDPTLPVTIETLRERFGRLTETPRFNALLLSGFAAAGLLLAAIGIYGVVAFLVSQRTREVGLRMALGATPPAITRLFLLHAARWTAAGLCLGLAGSLAATLLLRGLLFEVPEHDVGSIVAAAAILSAAALAAAWLPSRRAARIDPVRTLREE
jgi:predicted permease